MLRYLFLILVWLAVGGCGEKQETNTPPQAPPETAPSAPVAAVTDTLAALPQAAFEDLIRNLDRSDIIFYTSGLSAGGAGENARALLSFVQGGLPLARKQGCNATGRIDFYGQGQTLAEAEFFSDPACLYYVFTYKGEKFGAQMTAEGANFFQRMEQGQTQ